MQTTENTLGYVAALDRWNELGRVPGLQEAELLKASEELAAIANTVDTPSNAQLTAARNAIRRQRHLANIVIVAARALAAHRAVLGNTQRMLRRVMFAAKGVALHAKDDSGSLEFVDNLRRRLDEAETLLTGIEKGEAVAEHVARNAVQNAATRRDHCCIQRASSRPGMFLTVDDTAALAACPEHRLNMCVVRCGSFRFAAPAQDVGAIVRLIENDPEKTTYVRDISIHPDSELAIELKAVRP